RVGVQQCRLGLASQYGTQFPAEIIGVLHGYVHPLAGFGRMGVAGISGNKDTRLLVFAFVVIEVIEAIGDALADLVNRPPGNIAYLDAVGGQTFVRWIDRMS